MNLQPLSFEQHLETIKNVSDIEKAIQLATQTLGNIKEKKEQATQNASNLREKLSIAKQFLDPIRAAERAEILLIANALSIEDLILCGQPPKSILNLQ